MFAFDEFQHATSNAATEGTELAGNAASEEQSETLEHVTKTAEEVSTIVSSTVARMAEAKQFTRELSKQIHRIHEVVRDLKERG